MTTREIIAAHRQMPVADSLGQEAANLLRLLAEEVPSARTKDGLRLSDAADFRAWLRELAEELEK